MATAPKSKAKRNKNNSTGYHGVTRMPDGKFVAQIFHEGHTIRIGLAKKAVDAAKLYDAKALELKGEKAKLNFPS